MKSKFSEKLEKHSQEHLQDGEKYIIGIRVNCPGLLTAMSLGATGAAVGVVMAAQLHKKAQEKAGETLKQSSPQMALALTNKRMLIFKRSIFTGGARDLLGHINRDKIKSGEIDKTFFGYNLKINFKDDKTLELQGIKIDHCEEFINELNRQLTT